MWKTWDWAMWGLSLGPSSSLSLSSPSFTRRSSLKIGIFSLPASPYILSLPFYFIVFLWLNLIFLTWLDEKTSKIKVIWNWIFLGGMGVMIRVCFFAIVLQRVQNMLMLPLNHCLESYFKTSNLGFISLWCGLRC